MYTYTLLHTSGEHAQFELPVLLNVRTEFEHPLGTFQVVKIKWQATQCRFQIACRKIKDERWISDFAHSKTESFTMKIGEPLV